MTSPRTSRTPRKEESASPQPVVLTKPTFVKVSDLRPLYSGFSIKVKVGEVTRKINREYLDGSILRIYEAIVGDESGCMILTVRDAIFEQVKQGDTLVLKNAKVEMYHNFMRLSVDRWGLIEKLESDAVEKMDLTNNLSTVEYELVDARGRDEESKVDR